MFLYFAKMGWQKRIRQRKIGCPFCFFLIFYVGNVPDVHAKVSFNRQMECHTATHVYHVETEHLFWCTGHNCCAVKTPSYYPQVFCALSCKSMRQILTSAQQKTDLLWLGTQQTKRALDK